MDELEDFLETVAFDIPDMVFETLNDLFDI
jgi:hypothetical protein